MKTCAKKRFGQHFLRDIGAINRIVKWIRPEPDDYFIEIGAGDGALSSRLAPHVAHLTAIELDIDCIPPLKNALATFKNASILQGDILRLDLEEAARNQLSSAGKLRLAGNLPYNIATATIERLLHASLPIEDMSFMIQLEVAQRIGAKPGSRQYGFLSVFCQYYADVRIGFKVSPACFVPRPKVSSAMVRIQPKRSQLNPALGPCFEALCKAAFGYRRKTLANSLAKHPSFGAVADALLSHAGIDGSRRAEELTVKEYQHLAAVYSEFQ